MGFLRTNDLSEIKTGELNLDFWGLVKNREVVWKLNDCKNCKLSGWFAIENKNEEK